MVAPTSTTTTSGVTSRRDDELTDLLTKLYTMQEEMGAKPKTSMEDKKSKAANVVAMMGSGKKAEKKGGRFLELKSSIVDRLKTIHQLLLNTSHEREGNFGGGGSSSGENAKEVIKMQAEIREQIRQAGDEWTEMDAIYKKEARKKKSKFTLDELEVQSELVRRLHAELGKVKEAQMHAYAKGNRDVGVTKSLYVDSVMSKSSQKEKPSWAGASTGGIGGNGNRGGAALTSAQRNQILQLEERDADFDRQLDEIGEGIQDLAEIAALQGEEVKRQNALLEGVNSKMEQVNERMVNVNVKMKETLEEVGRPGGKMCVDIMCIVLAIGFAAVIYNLVVKGTI